MPASSRALGKVELPHIFAEVGLRRFAESIDRKAAPLPEVDLVRIHLEDLLFAEAMFELKRDDDLVQLALDPSLRRQKESARQLHGQRRPALNVMMSRRQIVTNRAQDADVVHAAMIEEAPVLDGHHGMHQVRRQSRRRSPGAAWCDLHR